MNIKVPYEKLGYLKSYKFISLILDKDKKSIYRKDFINSPKDPIFDLKRESVTIPQDLYEQCDSIIFFPFSNDNNWTNQVIMWKGDEFTIYNGGYEYLRNADKSGNQWMLDSWIARGKSYNSKSLPIGEKNLIYFTAFCNDEYMELLKILLRSLKNQPYQNFELLVITDESTKLKIESLDEVGSFTINYHVVNSVKNPVDASMEKLKIYNWKNIDNYKRILFLDLDVVVIGNLESIFESVIKNNVFYSATHNHKQSMHKTHYHCLCDYTREQLMNFEKSGITSINAGQFLFTNTPTMKLHFDNINSFILQWDGRYFFEQSFLNHYFNLLEMTDTKVFQEQFQFVSINEHQKNNVFGPASVFVHFMGNACNGLGKLEFMKKYYSKYVSVTTL